MLKFYQSDSLNPYENLAFERRLIDLAGDDFIVFFWANSDTIVVGRNQYAYAQYDALQTARDGIKIARRLSGGGAVFHDENNLLFSFIFNIKRYDRETGYQIMLKAMRDMDYNVEKSGRNDLLIDGRKFSGNAFLSVGDIFCHHGTVLIDTDTARLDRYLNVSEDKLSKNGVKSVKSRVINLSEIDPYANRECVMYSIWTAAERGLGESAEAIDINTLRSNETDTLRAFFEDKNFIFGKELKGYAAASRVIDGLGKIEVYTRGEGVIEDAKIFCDALILPDIARAESALIGKRGIDWGFVTEMINETV